MSEAKFTNSKDAGAMPTCGSWTLPVIACM
jgi:hypothetical protein